MSDRPPRYLIVNADDFGISAGVNRGVLEAHHRGILTSTSLMVRRPASDEAAALAREARDLSVGLHLELDRPAGVGLARAAEKQVEHFTWMMGRAPTHLDSHHDAHRDRDVLAGLGTVARRLGIPLRGHSPVRPLTRFYGQWGGETHLEQVSVASLVRMLETDVIERVTELVCHPGYCDAQLDSTYAREREAELETLCDSAVPAALQRLGIQLVGFRDLPTTVGNSIGAGMRSP